MYGCNRKHARQIYSYVGEHLFVINANVSDLGLLQWDYSHTVYLHCISLPFSLNLALKSRSVGSQNVTPLFIVRGPCLYARLKTVITFHYCWASRTPGSERGGGANVSQSLTRVNISPSTRKAFIGTPSVGFI